MSLSRRDRFEEQLRALQNDISQLSTKLAGSPGATDEDYRDEKVAEISKIDIDASMVNGADSGQMVRIKRDMHAAMRERDEALFKLEQAEREIAHLRAAAKEAGRLKVLNEQLKQEMESLRISFDSSERIRKQQKDLINLLQRSQTLDGNGSVNSALMKASKHLSGSNGIEMSDASIAELNRSWLNSVSDDYVVKYAASTDKTKKRTTTPNKVVSTPGTKNGATSRTNTPAAKRNTPSTDSRMAAGLHATRSASTGNKPPRPPSVPINNAKKPTTSARKATNSAVVRSNGYAPHDHSRSRTPMSNQVTSSGYGQTASKPPKGAATRMRSRPSSAPPETRITGVNANNAAPALSAVNTKRLTHTSAVPTRALL